LAPLPSSVTDDRSTARAQRGPDFLCIGAQKAGTTWLYANLRAHPGIWLPNEKELHYFDEKLVRRLGLREKLFAEDDQALRWRRQLRRQLRERRRRRSLAGARWDLRYFFGRTSDNWYLSLFDPGHGKMTGEITPAYSTLDDEAVAHISRLVPAARIILFLRNPIERSWSHARMAAKNGASHDTLARHFEVDASRIRGDYARTLAVWGRHFTPEQLFIGFTEDLHFHPAELLRRICGFLGVGELESWPFLHERVHAGARIAIPGPLATRLARLHEDLIARLDERFGGYASWWRYCAERLLADNISELPVPLYASELWDAWATATGLQRNGERAPPPIQSAALADLERRR
jgi:hypothetical protein